MSACFAIKMGDTWMILGDKIIHSSISPFASSLKKIVHCYVIDFILQVIGLLDVFTPTSKFEDFEDV